ncbi:MAG: 23S rRNA (adenine(2030)-N(6))-methyltransferase RlmJ [Methanothrix sp.]|nr:23S rRNA (adenine(2030)-N(6))-methyltransferase RlmJ [Methanothrix sp.]MDD4446038.1 23S rRNA (adenine(2030)-N(6))-methyltransferase RlmJ [Methanothrix sp.]
MSRYDHRVHAGNAGDVWKHFLLLEAADHLLEPGGSLVYAESHVGHPHYSLKSSGDWEGGIGKVWPLLPSLNDFCFFRILAELNIDRNGLLYPGSARLIYELVRRKSASLNAEIWDTDPDVSASWQKFFPCAAVSEPDHATMPMFHQEDGFHGVLSLLRRFSSGDLQTKLLFIDPPYIDSDDMRLAERLLTEAKVRGWIVLWWYMLEMKTAPKDLAAFELHFSEVGMDGGRWQGAAVAFAGPDCEAFERLLGQIDRQIRNFIQILKSIKLER